MTMMIMHADAAFVIPAFEFDVANKENNFWISS
jgi:hypothetical protein